MLLAIDAGNTQTVVGLFRRRRARRPLAHRDRRRAHLRRARADGAAVPRLPRLLVRRRDHRRRDLVGRAAASPPSCAQMTERYFGFPALVLEPGVRTGMPILYDNPKEVGADRIANAVGAYDLYGGPSIVVDFGTATTIEAISAKGEYLGGAIFPGIEITMDALFGRAAGLRRVELVEPEDVIGKSTAESIQSGMIYGFSAQVDGLVDRFVAELGDVRRSIATGGLAELDHPALATIQHYEPWLTLYGLRIIFERNR